MIFSLSQVDRAFLEIIRLALVQAGHLPDFAVLPGDQHGAARQAIISSGKSIIEVFGVGSYKSRQEVTNNKIVIDRLNTVPGSIGSWKVKSIVASDANKFRVANLPPSTYHVSYQVTYVTDTTEYDRIISELVFDCLGAQGTARGINPDGSKTANFFDYFQDDFKDNSGGNYIERVFRYEVRDVYLSKEQIIEDNIAPLTTFTPKVVQK